MSIDAHDLQIAKLYSDKERSNQVNIHSGSLKKENCIMTLTGMTEAFKYKYNP